MNVLIEQRHYQFVINIIICADMQENTKSVNHWREKQELCFLFVLQVEFAPSTTQMVTLVTHIAVNLKDTLSDIPRLPHILTNKRSGH